MSKRLLAGLLLGTAVTAAALPLSVQAAAYPVRWNTGAATWSTPQSAFATFVKDGSITDRGLAGGIQRSGWSATEVREGFKKNYDVNVVAVSKFLYSDAGVKFLKNATASYFPEFKQATLAMVRAQGGIVGWTAGAEQVLAGLG